MSDDASALTGGLPWAFETVTMRPLEPMLVPEKPRHGETDPDACGSCAPSEFTIWHDEHWQVRAGWDVGGLPFMGAISPCEEHVRIVAEALAAGGGESFPTR